MQSPASRLLLIANRIAAHVEGDITLWQGAVINAVPVYTNIAASGPIGGQKWGIVNAAYGTIQVNQNIDPNDQFQPPVTPGASGNVDVTWYGWRDVCPAMQSVTPGATNTYTDTCVQFFSPTPSGDNARPRQYPWGAQ